MRSRMVSTVLLGACLLTGVASAQTGSGTLGVTATVVGSISLTFVTDASGLAVTGTGTGTASLAFGTVSMLGNSVPTGVTRRSMGRHRSLCPRPSTFEWILPIPSVRLIP
jgi:hypothetical protein